MRNDLRVEWRWCAKIPSTRFLSIFLRSCKHLNVNVITNYVRVSVVLYSRDQRELRLRFEHDDFFFSLRFHTLDILSLYGMEILKITTLHGKHHFIFYIQIRFNLFVEQVR